MELLDPRHVDRYAAVVYSKIYDDTSYYEATEFQRRGIRIIFDLCDNHFYNPRELKYWRKARKRLRRMIALADEVVASTEAMAEVIKAELPTERSITVIGDAVETEIKSDMPVWKGWLASRQLDSLLRKLKAGQGEGRTPLVWFGNHGSPYAEGGMLDLQKIRALLERSDRKHPLSLTVISNSRAKYRACIKPWEIPTHYLTWHSETIFPALRAHAIAVIPMSDNPFTCCKSNNRLALALSEGLAVVADSIRSYEAFRGACYLADWEIGLESYLTDPHLRRSHVQLGRSIVVNEWTENRIADKWQRFFETALGEDRTSCRLI